MSATLSARQTTFGHRLDWPHGTFGDLAVLVFVIVQCLDGALTYLGVHTWGMGIEANPTTPEAIDAKMRADIDKWGTVIAKANIPQL